MIEALLPVLTALGAAAVTWHLARAQQQTALLEQIGRQKSALERMKKRNATLTSDLKLARAKLQFQQTLRSLEFAALTAQLPGPAAALEAGGQFEVNESLASLFRATREAEESAMAQPIRRRRVGPAA